MTLERLEAYLQAHAVQGELIRLAEHTPTVDAAARALGVPPEQIVKSVLFLADGAPILVIANGTARVDYKRVADHLGLSRKKVKLADPEAVLTWTGFAVGTVPPCGHATPLRTLLEAGVLEQSEVFGGGGAIDAMLRITPAEIIRVTQAQTVAVTAAAAA